jgi:preprotein translocase subunit SecE
MTDKDKDEKVKAPNAIQKWWRETLGELHKVSWPTVEDARKLTIIVIVVMFLMAVLLGTLDWVFSKIITLILA